MGFINFHFVIIRFCHLPMTPDEPHPMNQNIMISNGKFIINMQVSVQCIFDNEIKVFMIYNLVLL